jgi:von Willebrand factor A domain-containing protein 8
VVVFDDSPLVKAMEHGRILVIDEFDKAPTEVVVVLKALLEDGEILLADGRRYVRADSPMLRQDLGQPALSLPAYPQIGQIRPAKGVTDDELVTAAPVVADHPRAAQIRRIHPAFLVIALANRPGFPFLGNDFFREMGDAFACHAVHNPDQASEIALLQKYAPTLPLRLLQLLTGAFAELRQLTDQGKLSYPYSTRELVNVVRHMSAYPGDSVGAVLENVFAFDAFDPQLRALLFAVFRRHGIPLGGGRTSADDGAAAGGKSFLAAPSALPAAKQVGRMTANETRGRVVVSDGDGRQRSSL